ncbi:hypothetical protein BJ875DRAFT_459975 [Amylocarpus encephaloides]|uniref:Uncharacterized protein n=1 Tax=Amylocarpus encephaloides TaxID=45428 RepID=A0A9P7YJU3_9HELO|nr:hypothetical protein BJ875DRAFT_459975 [Amylocarpus encephaloides]
MDTNTPVQNLGAPKAQKSPPPAPARHRKGRLSGSGTIKALFGLKRPLSKQNSGASLIPGSELKATNATNSTNDTNTSTESSPSKKTGPEKSQMFNNGTIARRDFATSSGSSSTNGEKSLEIEDRQIIGRDAAPKANESTATETIEPEEVGNAAIVHEDGTTRPAPPTSPRPEHSSTRYEPPLQRPKDEDPPTPVLAPHNDFSQTQAGPDGCNAFINQRVSFAVDVSGSTQGLVLEQERWIIGTISRLLSDHMRSSQAEVLPWTGYALPVIGTDELNQLHALTGTCPSVLNTYPTFTRSLQQCSAWVLITDGQISEYEGKRFALGICDNEYHGTACVIIVVGYKARRPIDCDVSVGLAVFSSTPDCLFLFHDVETQQVYVLQSKGVFNAVLPQDCSAVNLDNDTRWSDLPPFFYEQLSTLRITKRQRLKRSEISLQSGKVLDFKNLCRYQIDAETANEILDNDDDLKTLLLSARIRGLESEVQRWIGKQQLQAKDPLTTTRPVGQALRYTKDLLSAIIDKLPEREKEILRCNLRIAHRANWASFLGSINLDQEAVVERSYVVQDAMTRIDLNRQNCRSGSPAALSPVSHRRAAAPTPPAPNPGYGYGHGYGQPSYPITGSSNQHPSYIQSSYSTGAYSNYSPPSPQPVYRRSFLGRGSGSQQHSKYLYTKHYQPASSSNASFRGYCAFCGEDDAVLAILIKKPPDDEKTDPFPEPNARNRTLYPFAMGVFPETDILSSYVCCDPCSYFLVLAGQSPYDEPLVGAIPLVGNIGMDGVNNAKSIETIDTALCGRFHKPVVPTIFLAILHSTLQQTLDRISMEPEEEISAQQINVLQWLSSEMANHAWVPMDDPCFVSLLTGYTSSCQLPLSQALASLLSAHPEMDLSLMEYPLPGFATLMFYVTLFNVGLDRAQFVAYQRLLFLLLDNHYDLLKSGQSRIATGELNTVMSAGPSFANAQSTNQSRMASGSRTPSSTSHILKSIPSHLSEEDIAIFQNLGPIFTFIDRNCGAALEVFLVYLSKITIADPNWTESFKRLREHRDLRDIIEKPETIDAMDAEFLIRTVIPQCIEDDTGKVLGPAQQIFRCSKNDTVPYEDSARMQHPQYTHGIKQQLWELDSQAPLAIRNTALRGESDKTQDDFVGKEGNREGGNVVSPMAVEEGEKAEDLDNELDEFEDSKFA